MKRAIPAILFFAMLVGLWQVLYMRGIWSPVVLPSPTDVATYLWKAILDGSLGQAAVTTMKRLLIGYTIGCLGGLPLGLLTARSKFLEDTIGVLALGLQTCLLYTSIAGFPYIQDQAL